MLYGEKKKSAFAKEKFGDKAREIAADSIILISYGNGLVPLKKELYDRVLVINPIQENLSPEDSSGASDQTSFRPIWS